MCRVAEGERWSGNDDISVVMRSTDGGQHWSAHEVPAAWGACT
jgi:hypothetical protein